VRTFNSERWLDGSSWQVQYPSQWTVRRDEAYIFESPHGCILRLGIRKHCEYLNHEYVPVVLNKPAAEQYCHRLTMSERGNSPYWIERRANRELVSAIPLTGHNLGLLVGYTYAEESAQNKSWRGHFSSGIWRVYANLQSPIEYVAPCEKVAQSILASMRFEP